MQPLIGITANFIKDSEFGVSAHIGGQGQRWHALADDYINAVVQAGGLPVILPVLPNEEIADAYLRQLDGILFSGGADITPLSYGENMTMKVGEICEERDRQEMYLMQVALKMEGFPILCICRGCQLLNAALGGTLALDIDNEKQGDHFFVNQRMQIFTHKISKQENSLISGLLHGEERVNSYHHQCVSRPGNGVVVTATDVHGVPECIEVPGRKGFTLGVQWHPEGLAGISADHLNIFKAFIQAAGEREGE